MIELLALWGLTALAGAATVKSSRNIADDSGSTRASSSWSPPPQTYAPPPQNYGGHEPTYSTPYDGGYAPYEEMPYQQQGFYPPQNEVVIHSKDGFSFYADADYDGRRFNMHIDTGANVCVVGDNEWSWLRRIVHAAGSATATIANGSRVKTTRFTFPYLTLVGADGQSFVTAQNVEAVYMAGQTSGLLGMSFLRQTHFSVSGNQMIIRG